MNVYEHLQRIAYRLRNDRRYACYDELCSHLNLSRPAMVELQNQLIRRLIDHAYKCTRYYRQLFDAHGINPGDIRCKEDLRRIPLLTKAAIRENFTDMKSNDAFGADLREVTSGGSTGETAIICKSRIYEERSRAVALRNNTLAGWYPGDKSAWFWGAPYEHQHLAGSMTARLGMLINRRLIFNTYRYSPDDFPHWADRILNFQPRVIYGYATALLAFARHILESRTELPSVQVVVSSVEKLEHRDIIAKAFSAPVFDQYGCREVIGVGIEVSPGVLRIADDFVVLNLHEGNEIILTPLYSLGFPLINYRVGDYAEPSQTEPDPHDALPLSRMSLRIGRITDNFLTPSNRIVSSSALSVYISTFKLGTQAQQIVQEDYRRFRIRFVAQNLDQNRYEDTMRAILAEYFGPGLSVTFERVEDIPVEPSGKRLMAKRTFHHTD